MPFRIESRNDSNTRILLCLDVAVAVTKPSSFTHLLYSSTISAIAAEFELLKSIIRIIVSELSAIKLSRLEVVMINGPVFVSKNKQKQRHPQKQSKQLTTT